jgi:hypothetical protein
LHTSRDSPSLRQLPAPAQPHALCGETRNAGLKYPCHNKHRAPDKVVRPTTQNSNTYFTVWCLLFHCKGTCAALSRSVGARLVNPVGIHPKSLAKGRLLPFFAPVLFTPQPSPTAPENTPSNSPAISPLATPAAAKPRRPRPTVSPHIVE